MSRKQTLSNLLSDYQPVPSRRFYQKMADAPWQKGPMMNTSVRPARFAWQIAAAVVLVLLVLSLSIPAVRASLSAWLGLSVAPSNQMPATSVELVAPSTATPAPAENAAPTALEPTSAPAPVSNKPAEIQQLSAQAGWDIPIPSRLPEGYQFKSAYFDAKQHMVIITYLVTRPLPGAADASLTESKAITFLQAQANDFIPMQVAPSASVIDVQVNGQPAAYTIGAWDTEFVKDDKAPNGGKMVSTWRNDLPVKNLYWQVGPVYLALITDDAAVSQEMLLEMAERVK